MRLREDVSAVRRLWKDLEVVVKEAKEGGGTWWSRLENDMTFVVSWNEIFASVVVVSPF